MAKDEPGAPSGPKRQGTFHPSGWRRKIAWATGLVVACTALIVALKSCGVELCGEKGCASLVGPKPKLPSDTQPSDEAQRPLEHVEIPYPKYAMPLTSSKVLERQGDDGGGLPRGYVVEMDPLCIAQGWKFVRRGVQVNGDPERPGSDPNLMTRLKCEIPNSSDLEFTDTTISWKSTMKATIGGVSFTCKYLVAASIERDIPADKSRPEVIKNACKADR